MHPRRALMTLPFLLAGCAGLSPEGDRIVETATGRVVACAELAAVLQHSRYALLGEQHDQVAHHQRRGALLARLGPTAALVAEHLPRGATVTDWSAGVLPTLEAAGFRARAWEWPLHQPLFDAVAASGLPLSGGNLDDATLRAVLGQGEAALPAPTRALLAAAPLDAPAQAALDDDLQQSHGGQIPVTRMQAMRTVQRARDASMLLALQASGGRPAVLLAGNGHVRADYGVPQLLRAADPQAEAVSVGFATRGETLPGRYTYRWTVDPAQPVAACR